MEDSLLVRLLRSLAIIVTSISASLFAPQSVEQISSSQPSRQATVAQGQPSPSPSPSPTPLPLPSPTVRSDAYRTVAGRIIGAALTSDKAYGRLAHLTDHIGNRLSGSQNLERAIAWAIAEMKADGLDNVRGEKVMVPHWVRGEESLEVTGPVTRKLSMLGLGNSVGTPPEGISAEAVVVRNFDQLEALGEQVRGKIVVYNAPFTNYGETVRYRMQGASRAAYDEIEIARWLLKLGMDPDAKAAVDADGFGGYTALFATVVSQPNYWMNRQGKPQAAELTQLLLEHGANPNARGSLRKQLHPGYAPRYDMGIHEYRDVTALGWGRQFHAKDFVSEPAMRMIAERGGHE